MTDRFPLYKIAWRMLWILPLAWARLIFVAAVFVFTFADMRDVRKAWEVTG